MKKYESEILSELRNAASKEMVWRDGDELWMKGDLLPRRAEKRQGVHLHWYTPRPFRMGNKD